MKEIDLENMSGEDFEIICQEIFSKFYKVPVDRTPLVGDGGKDLIIRSADPVYVECKHHKNTIGRPVIQKLHSAMVTDWVKRGIVVTTGSFSSGAIKHIKDNSLPIELIDGKKLNQMASSVGIKLYFGYDVKANELMIYEPPLDSLKKYSFDCIKHIRSSPYPIERSFVFIGRNLTYSCYYLLDYEISQDFLNSNKEYLVHSINARGKLLLDVYSLKPMPDHLVPFYLMASFRPTSESSNPPHIQPKHIRLDVENSAYETLISAYSRKVSYFASKNKHKEKTFVPSRSHIQLSNYSIAYIPTLNVDYSLLGRRMRSSLLYNGYSFFNTTALLCDVCKSNYMDQSFLCNDCASIVCGNHHLICDICGKTLCSNCGVPYKSGFLKTGIACKKCVSDNPDLKMKNKK